jgi:hypothetical protein
MAYKRKPRALRSRRPLKKARMLRPLRPKTQGLMVHRKFWAFNWSPATTVTNDFWKYFSQNLNNLPDYAQYTAVFDQYRIKYLKFTLIPRYDSFAGNDTTDTTLPGVTNQAGVMVHVIIDPSSIITPSGSYNSTNLNTFMENGRVKTYSGNKPITFTVKYPCIADDVNGTASSKHIRAPWINTTNFITPHRGAHVFVQDVNLTGVFGQQFDVFCQMGVQFKGMK